MPDIKTVKDIVFSAPTLPTTVLPTVTRAQASHPLPQPVGARVDADPDIPLGSQWVAKNGNGIYHLTVIAIGYDTIHYTVADVESGLARSVGACARDTFLGTYEPRTGATVPSPTSRPLTYVERTFITTDNCIPAPTQAPTVCFGGVEYELYERAKPQVNPTPEPARMGRGDKDKVHGGHERNSLDARIQAARAEATVWSAYDKLRQVNAERRRRELGRQTGGLMHCQPGVR